MVCSDPADSYKLLPRPHQIMGLLTENDESCEKPDFPEEGETGTREHLVIFLRVGGYSDFIFRRALHQGLNQFGPTATGRWNEWTAESETQLWGSGWESHV